MDADFATALRLHQSGQHAAAAQVCESILARHPDQADALNLYGLLHQQNGCPSRALELIGRAAVLRPDAAGLHANLAEAYRALGRHEEAVACCRTALRLQPQFPVALNNLGLALQGQGRDEEAAQQFRLALAQRPGFALAEHNLGNSLRKLNRLGEAIEAYRAALRLAPDLTAAHVGLAQLFLELGRFEEALPHGREAVRLQPGLPGAHEALANTLCGLGHASDGKAAHAESRRLAAGLARLHADRGLILCREGRRADAFVCLRQAVELAPEDAEMWHRLADVHLADEDHPAAIFCLERSVALDPTQPNAHSDLGALLEDSGRRVEAAACFRRALELDPRHVESLVNQGDFHEVLGDMSQAADCYRRAQAANPFAATPLARLATHLRGNLPDSDLRMIESLLADPKLAKASRSGLLFGLAQIMDARGDYSSAARCLTQANALAQELRLYQGHHYDPTDQVRYIDRVIENYTPELFARLGGKGEESRLPVFVVGLPRSGSTLVEQVLASHSKVHGAGELRLVRQVCNMVPALVGRENDLKTCLGALDAPALKELARRYLEEVQAMRRRDRPDFFPERIVDKLPDNYLYLGMLALIFPRATFIHIRRDLRDVAVSCWMTGFRSIRWADNMDHLAARFRDHERIMAHWRAVLPVHVHEVNYERLVEDFPTEAQRLVQACGLEWEPACLKFHQSKRPVRTASVAQVRQPLYRSSAARWKHYEKELADLFAKLPN